MVEHVVTQPEIVRLSTKSTASSVKVHLLKTPSLAAQPTG